MFVLLFTFVSPPDGLGLGDATGLGLAEGDGLGLALGLGLGDAVGLGVELGLGVGEGKGLGLTLGLGVVLGDGLGLALGDGLGVGEQLGEGAGLGLGLGLGEPCAKELLKLKNSPPKKRKATKKTIIPTCQLIFKSLIARSIYLPRLELFRRLIFS